MTFSKKNQVHLQVLLFFKNISYNVFNMLLGIFHSLDQFQTLKKKPIKITLCKNNSS
jgi:hypothetical protein